MIKFRDLIKKPWTWTILPALLFALPFSLRAGWGQWLGLEENQTIDDWGDF